MTAIRSEISVSGLVQGVGFRPFCYRLATKFGLKGTVRNMGDAGVQIILEGERGAIENFIQALGKEKPPLARIDGIGAEWKPATGEFKDFSVVESGKGGLGLLSVIPPDIAICDDCLREMFDPKGRRYRYPFTTCVNCGPRFTIIRDLPYDRERTSMEDFPLCGDCRGEYTNPSDRRYHAEPTCCSACGPEVRLHHASGESHEVEDPLREASKLLDEGKIVVIKGIGGMHVAAKVTEDGPLQRLREAFKRPQQPFAIMSKDLETVRTFAEVGADEEERLKSPQRPIVVLRSKIGKISELVSPGLDSIGVMLPYNGIQHIILRDGKEPAYVMTSANLPGLPMVLENEDAISKFGGLVDYFLLHNRRIINRCDDSVVRLTAGAPVFLRRSRGYAPMPLDLQLPKEANVLALGAEFDVVATLLKGGRCFPTQHIGDVSKLETMGYLRQAVERLMRLLNLEKIDVVACDLHPQYATSSEAESFAREFNAKLVRVQHHHAHLAALMAEHGIDEIVGIDADGVGYGADGTLWGGEVMVASHRDFERVGALASQPMPGGDLATRFPARAVAGILWGALQPKEVENVLGDFCLEGFRQGEDEIKAVIHQLEIGMNVFRSSSCGRVLDAVSCILGVCRERTYEGEPAIKLEAFARGGDESGSSFKFSLKREKGFERVDTSKLLLDVLEAMKKGDSKRDIAARAQIELGRGLAELAVKASKAKGIETIGARGGVFYNDAVSSAVWDFVDGEGLKFLMHRQVPPGDGGISIGQAVVAAHRSTS